MIRTANHDNHGAATPSCTDLDGAGLSFPVICGESVLHACSDSILRHRPSSPEFCCAGLGAESQGMRRKVRH